MSDVEASDTIDHVKAKIQGNEGIPLDQQRLVTQARNSRIGRLLSGYDIQTLVKSEAYLSALWARCQGEPIFDGANTLNALRAQHLRPDSGPRSVDNGALGDSGRGLTSLPALLCSGSEALTKDFDAI